LSSNSPVENRFIRGLTANDLTFFNQSRGFWW
jgi:hypothetical protein